MGYIEDEALCAVTRTVPADEFSQRRLLLRKPGYLVTRPRVGKCRRDQAGELVEIKVARSTFDTWRSLGCAPECIKLPNGQIRVRRCALEAWLTSRTR